MKPFGFTLLVSAWVLCGAQQDNFPPSFNPVLASVNIQELQEVDENLLIYDANATDPEGDNFTYVIPVNSLNSNLFRVEIYSGRVFTQSGVILDRETLSSEDDPLDLFIEARDEMHDVYPQFHLIIVLQDINDNPPIIFPQSTTVSVPEDTALSYVLVDVEASDADVGINGFFYFELQQSSTLFSIDREDGKLRLIRELDYDDPSTRLHVITVVVEDLGEDPLRGQGTVEIHVEDVDDLDPEFEPSFYSMSISENSTLGTFVLRVSAKDGDRGLDTDIFYTLDNEGNSLIDGNLSFVINSTTGEIFVNVASLDRETHSFYSLTVQAAQVDNANKSATAMVSISVLDINDNIPVFDPVSYSVSVSENTMVGEILLNVSVTDQDEHTNADFELHLEDLLNSTTPLPFNVSASGDIILSSQLDFERTEYYLFNVIATEGEGGNASAQVRVDVENENDASPVFQPVIYYGNVSEGVDPPTFIAQVKATDEDRGVFGDITYSISGGHFDDFYIVSTDGAVFTENKLDYENRSSYTILIDAIDTGNRTAQPPATLIVDVVNMNDNPPMFDRESLTVELEEEVEEGTVVVALNVTDRDGDNLTYRSFSITAGNDLGNFTFDPNSENVVITSSRLDYDESNELQEYTLTLTVNDTRFADEITLTIKLVDINDNGPVFQNQSYEFEVFEDAAAITDIGGVNATDIDSGDLGDVQYSIFPSDKFGVNPSTGRVFTRVTLNREEQSNYTVNIIATDQDPVIASRKSQTVVATIIVLDINDNPPRFTRDEYGVSLTENIDIVAVSVTASDIDEGTNADITYELIDGNTNNAFVIDGKEGVLSRNPNVTLDREVEDYYLLTVSATDSGTPHMNATATIEVTIMDENDEEPILTPAYRSTSIPEDTQTDTFVMRVTASDADTPSNAMLRYSLTPLTGPLPRPGFPTPPSGSFTIDQESGEITTQGEFDREDFEGPYVLQVEASDGYLTGTAVVTVYLTDINDNDPIFQPTTYTQTLAEELPAGQSVVTVTAIDLDAGSNGMLSYRISSIVALSEIEDQSLVASHFTVNTTTGVVQTATSLDYEFVQSYEITVTATDNGDSERSSSATVTVRLSDANDHTPQFFSDDYVLSLPESTLRNRRFSLFYVTDRDSGDNSRLSFSANISAPLSVDSETGEVVLLQSLDYEAATSYIFTVNVTDNGAVPNTNSTEVMVVVEDVNDNSPVFQNSSYSAVISEGITPLYTILTINATDRDTGDYGTVSYRLLSGASPLFSLDGTGNLLVVEDVDFENLTTLPGASEVDLQLTVEARDRGGLTSTADITVTVTDENDNIPIFIDAPYTGSVRENSLPGLEVVAVMASDRDNNENGVVRYSIDNSENFSIDEVTGVITTGTDSSSAMLYDYESNTKTYSLLVCATDNGTDAKTTNTTVTVTILDTNDNSPVIESVDGQFVMVPEDAGMGTPVGAVINVRDYDDEENGQVNFTLSNDGGVFAVSSSGEVIVAGELDRETQAEYNITIIVTDRGQPQRTAETYVWITVEDVNDNAPTFTQEACTVAISERTGENIIISRLTVEDRDSLNNGEEQISFRIVNDPPLFTVEQSSQNGDKWVVDVKTAVGSEFDYDTEPRSYLLMIEASNQRSPPLTATTSLTVTLFDVNDERPEFSLSSYSFSVPHYLSAGGTVGSVLAIDSEESTNGMVSYDFADGTPNSIKDILSLHTTTGVLTLKVRINSSVDFSVEARDGEASEISTASVRVNVKEIANNAPRFTEDLYSVTVLENQVSPEVSTIRMESSGVTYSIVAGANSDFSLDSSTGGLTTTGPLDRETTPLYIFTVRAEDDTGRVNYTQVIVTVGDDNDEKPTFPLDSYTYCVNESSPVHTTLVPYPSAMDADLGNNGIIDYFLQPSSSHPFHVDQSTGVVSLTGELDREETSSYTLILEAVDRGILSMTGTTVLRITVVDNDDEPPMFEKTSYSANILENSPEGVFVAMVNANDQDDTTDSLTYSITNGDPVGQFYMDPVSGVITTTAVSLDREIRNEYTLTVSATDDFRMGEAEVLVSIGDVNDNSPLFTKETIVVTLDENNNDYLVVAEVTANDKDEGSNGRVAYRITGGNRNNIFDINSASGQVVAKAGKLDYETEPMHTLTIEASDQASPDSMQRFSTAEVTVILRDINDNRPTFSQSLYTTTLMENAETGSTVAVVLATDGDTGTNGQISYRLEGSPRLFAIDGTSGVVTVTGNVDFESGQEHELSVEASDNGNPKRSNVVTLHIEVINVEDEPPQFPISFYSTSVSEVAQSSTSVLTVSATDPDGTESLIYDIIQSSSEDGSSYFTMDPDTGLISTAGTLDRESVSVVNLNIIATDSAGNNSTGTVQITIEDVNDNSPQFNADYYTASLRENSPVGTIIVPFFDGRSTRVEATDADGPGVNSLVSYDKEGEDANKFSVDKDSGVVTVAAGAVLDREADQTLELIITAEDAGDRASSITMTITLEDENDNIPFFIPKFGYALSVPEDTEVGTVLTVAEAVDPDMAGDIFFTADTSSPTNKFSYFSINSTTGAISLEMSLDREQDPFISLMISAHDSGTPSLASRTAVQITVTDVNDNQPIFSQETYIAIIPETHTIGASVLTVMAEDPDFGTNGQVEYRVVSEQFSVNRDTGELTTAVALDYETQRIYDDITVLACDKDPQSNCSAASVTVYVTDSNDNLPSFDFSLYRTDICHTHTVNEVFMQPVATDRDSGNNSQLTYSLEDASGLMSIWPDSGRIFLSRSVEPEEVGSQFTAVITAKDGGIPMLSDSAEVVVRILNCTLDPFRFVVPIFEAKVVEEKISSGQTVVMVTDSSGEQLPGISTVPVGAQAAYFSPELPNNPFTLTSTVLTISEPLDREIRGFYTLPVIAMGSMAYATIMITVLDENDRTPLLQLPSLSFTVSENTSDPVYITTAIATDDDIGNSIQFSFSADNENFSINGDTGVVTTAMELDREEVAVHQLSIQATDGVLSDEVTITVSVADVNDNPPVFQKDSYSVAVLENSPQGTSVLRVEATDQDLGENATISFSPAGGDVDLFTVDSETGLVTTLAELDFEANPWHSLIVRASDNGASPLSSLVEINITVVDLNDHTPTFLNPLTLITILEGVEIGMFLTDFDISDSDSGDLGEDGVIFAIIAEATDLFSVDNITGILRTAALLDRDEGPECHFLTIQATDSAGENSLSNVIEIQVCLLDENDNCPEFIQPSFSGLIRENQETNQPLQLRVQATDDDSEKDTNGAVVLRLLRDGGVFEIDSSTGFLSLTSSLDTETTPSYELVVEACDRGAQQCCTNATITVDVLDVNDNRPEITNINTEACTDVLETNDAYSCQGSLHEIGDSVFIVNATDRDSGLNGAILYDIVGDSPFFDISSSGVITIADQLDYETQNTHQLYINAYDQGNPLTLTSETRILCINVVDINDRVPSFSVTQYNMTQDEGPLPDAAILNVFARDEDFGDNAAVSYSITSGNTSIFRIDEETGQIFLLEELDCETTSSFSLTVTANNSLSTCPLSSTVQVLILVGDINDNPPVLGKDMYNATIPENVPHSEEILRISATDADKTAPNNELQYRLLLGAGSNPFHLDDEGRLTVQNALDAESLPGLQYTFSVEVRDSGEVVMRDTATVVILLEDINDEAPFFSQNTFSVDVSEGEDTPFLLLPLTFSDEDIEPINRESFITIASVTGYHTPTNTIVTFRGSDAFYVNENNTLELRRGLDRENISFYDITVAIANTAECYQQDGGQCSGSAVVEVIVTDVNDNYPRFSSQLYSGEVSVTASVGTSVLRVDASDDDTGNFAAIRYGIADSLDGRFRIDEETGVILTRGNFENLDGQTLSLTVLVSDNPDSSPSLTSTATVTLVVLNDFQRISVLFSCGINTILQSEQEIIGIIANVSGLDIQVENYADHSDDIRSNFIFHATDPNTNKIVDFDEFFARQTDSGVDKDTELINKLSAICPVEKITAFANIDDYSYPDALDTQTIVILVLCVILVAGAISTLILSIRQRWVALHDTRSKLLADVFYGSPGSASLVENVHHENMQLEELGKKTENQQNPMFLQPYDNWDGLDASGPESTGDISSMNRDNPLYESQEIRMEMFADVSDEEEGDEADDAELLAAALKEDEEPEDNSVTAI